MEKLIMIMTITGGEACGSPEHEPDGVTKRPLLICVQKDHSDNGQKTGTGHGVAPAKAFSPRRSRSGKQELASAGLGLVCPEEGSSGIEERRDNSQDDQDDGWGVYEDNYDSDSDIDDDEDQDDEVKGRRKGPIYAFLVYGGVRLRPDEYVLLFRALGVSPQYIEQLQR